MSGAWTSVRQSRSELDRRARLQLEKDVRWYGRLDAVGLAVILGLFALFASGGLGLVWLHERHGLFDEPILASIPDDRLLSNIRPRHNQGDFVDMGLDSTGRALLVLTSERHLLRFDLDTELWSEDLSASLATDLASPARSISVGCAGDGSDGVSPCPGDRWYAILTEEGGVAVKAGEGWQTLLSDVPWIGLDGTPLDHEQITSVALGPGIVALGTAEDGIGLFDVELNRWHPIAPAQQAQLLSAAGGDEASLEAVTSEDGKCHAGPLRILDIAFQGDELWVATCTRLSAISFDGGLHVRTIPKIEGPITAMVPTKRGLFVLRQGPTPQIWRLGPDGNPLLVAGGETSIADLDSSSLVHGGALAGQAVAFGDAGVHAYDLEHRHWRNVDDQPVTSVFEPSQGTGYLYGYSGGAALLTAPQPPSHRWSFDGLPVQVIADVAGSRAAGEALVRASNGKLFRLDRADAGASSDSLEPAFERQGTAFAPTGFRTAAAIGDQLIMLGPEGALIHDVRLRRYRDMAPDLLPHILRQADTVLAADDHRLWGMRPKGEVAEIAAIEYDQDGGISGRAIDVKQFQGPLVDFDLVPGGAILVDRAGRGHEIVVNGTDSLDLVPGPVGQVPGGALGLPVAALAEPGTLHLATANKLWRYTIEQRRWHDDGEPRLNGQRIIDLANAGGVVVLGSGGLALDAGRNSAIFGDGPPMPFASRSISDAIGDADTLLLAGDGKLIEYDVGDRKIDRSWTLAPSGEVFLAGKEQDLPIYWNGMSAKWGDRTLAVDAATVESVSIDVQEIVTVQRRPDGGRFLAFFDKRSAPDDVEPRCLLFEPSPGASTAIDARRISGDRTIVLTERGLRIYDETARRWYRGPELGVSSEDRLFRLGEYLAYSADGRIHVMPIDSIDLPKPCEAGLARWSAQPLTADSWSVAEDRGEILLLKENGAVYRWRAGSSETLIGASGTGPNPSSLRFFVRNGDELLFASSDAIWTYDLGQRRWYRASLQRIGNQEADRIAIEISNGRVVITARSSAGQSFSGLMESRTDAVQLSPVQGMNLPAAPFNPAALLDVVELGPTKWLFLLPDELALFDVVAGLWRHRFKFAEPSSFRRLATFDGQLVVEEGPEAGPTVLYLVSDDSLEQTGGSSPIERHAFVFETGADLDWRLIVGGSLWRIDPLGAAHRCNVTKPGTVENGCEIVVPAALDLSDVEPVMAHEWGSRVLLRTNEGLRLLERRDRLVLAREGDFNRLDREPPAEMVGISDSLWLRFADGALMSMDQAGKLSPEGNAIDPLGRAFGGTWVDDGTAPRMILGDRLLNAQQSLTEQANEPDLPVPILGSINGLNGYSALLEDGTLVHVDARLRRYVPSNLLSFPRAPQPEEILAVVADVTTDGRATGAWWLQLPEQFLLVEERACTLASEGRGDISRPCLAPRLRLAPPGPGKLRAAAKDEGGSRRFVIADRQWLLDTASLAWRDDGLTSELLPAAPSLDGITDELKRDMRVVDGRTLLDVPDFVGPAGAALELDSGPERPSLRVGRPARREGLEPLDHGWISWHSANRAFDLAGLNGLVRGLSPSRVLSRDGWIAGGEGHWLRLGARDYAFANMYGTFWFDDAPNAVGSGPRSLIFDSPKVQGPIHAAHGEAVYAEGSAVNLRTGAQGPASGAYEVTIGDLRISEDADIGLDAVMTVAGNQVSAFASRGFAFDTRFSVARESGTILAATPIGIGPVTHLSSYRPLPGNAHLEDRLWSRFDRGAVYWRGANEWRQWTNGGWQAAADPSTDWSMTRTDDPTWFWHKSRGRIEIEPRSTHAPERFRHHQLIFHADVLLGAAAAPNGAVAVTALGSHWGNTVAGALDAQRAEVAAPSQAKGTVRAALLSLGNGVVSAGSGDLLVIWDQTARRWVQPASDRDPSEARLPWQGNWLRVAFRSEVPVVEVATLDLVTGNRDWRGHTWQNGEHPPFDHATALFGEGRDLLIGTRAGLQQFRRGPTGIDLVSVMALEGADETRVPVTAIGRPHGEPGVIAFRSPETCLLWRATDQASSNGFVTLDQIGRSAKLERCSAQNLLDHRYRGANSFWYWLDRVHNTTERRVLGFYLDESHQTIGPVFGETVGAVLPHDRFLGVGWCGDGHRYLWQAASFDGGSTLRLTLGSNQGWSLLGSTNQILDRAHIDSKLICMDQPESYGLPSAMAGTYLASESGHIADSFNQTGDTASIYRLLARRIMPLDEPATSAVVGALAQDRLPASWSRLRVVLAENADQVPQLRMEYRALDDIWRQVAWDGGTLEIDLHQQIATAHGHVWAKTGPGWLRLHDHAGQLGVEPTEFRLALMGDATAPCDVTEVQTLDGRTAGWAAANGEPTLARCRDGALWQGILDGQRDGTGAPAFLRLEARAADQGAAPPDPFAQASYSSPDGCWAWQSRGRGPGQRGVVSIEISSEPVSLAGGLFSIDDWSSIAGPRDEVGQAPSGDEAMVDALHVVGAEGWHMQLKHDLSLCAGARPPLASAGNTVNLSFDRPNTSALDELQACAQLGDGSRLTLDGKAGATRVGSCRSWRGQAHLWQYRLTEDELLAYGRGKFGSLQLRRIDGGRFTDLTAVGTPITSSMDGKDVLLVPTRLGFGAHEFSGRQIAIVGARTTTGHAVSHRKGIGALLWDGGGARRLENAVAIDACEGLAKLFRDGFGAMVERIVYRGGGLYELAMGSARGRRQMLVDCRPDGQLGTSPWGLYADTSGNGRLLANRDQWPNHRPYLGLAVRQGSLVNLADDSLVAIDDNPGLSPIRTLISEDGAFLLERDDIRRAEVDALVSATHDSMTLARRLRDITR